MPSLAAFRLAITALILGLAVVPIAVIGAVSLHLIH
jgi:hypothetical protein